MNTNQNQQNQQNGQPRQQGQAETPAGQLSQDNRPGQGSAAGQQDPRSQQDQRGQEASRQGQPGQAQGKREVAASGQQPGRQVAGQTGSALLPPVDIYEDESGFTLLADMPGVAKEQLVVRVSGDSLLIEGAATVPVSGTMELVYGEVQTPQYRRSFTLSRELDPGKIEAKLANGVLTLRIPKAEEAKPRRIEVSVG